MNFLRLTLSIITISTFFACFAIAESFTTSCIDVSGEYLFEPKDKEDPNRSNIGITRSAYEFLWGTYSCTNCSVDKIILEQKSCSSLLIKPYANNEALTELSFDIKESTQSKLLIGLKEKRAKNEIALNVSTQIKDYVLLGSNNELIIKRDISQFTWLLFIPYWSTEGFEIAFPAAHPSIP